ncbi:MAG: hypothetical protein HJJLKODD_02058 [Phycisphaerae bacterium]|nr:hypothetical protein [Phycisphaerae bacterium]
MVLRRRILPGACGFVVLFISGHLSWADDVPSSAPAISKENLTTHLNYLAGDELGGRGVGTEGIDQAAEYIVEQFKRYGLQPGGEQGSYYQEFTLPITRQITDACRLEMTGLEPPPQRNTDFLPMPFSSNQPFSGPLTFIGYGITAPEKKYDDYSEVDVQGHVLLMLRYEPAYWGNGKERSSHAYFRSKAEQARQHGAAAILIVNLPDDTPDSLYDFNLGGASDDYGLPMFHIRRPLAEKLLQQGGLPDLKSLYQKIEDHQQPASVTLSELKITGTPGLSQSELKTRNIIGILPGQGPLANEYVVFGAHYDHLGTVPPTMMPAPGKEFPADKVQIHNGADDNASGTAGVLELARLYADGQPPARTLIFMTFSAEEMGLLGSRYYVDHPTIPLNNVITMINLDMIGRLGDKPITVHGAKTGKNFEALVKKHAEQLGIAVNPIGTGFGGSDHTSFYLHEIPVLFMFTGFHPDYHKPTDDPDKIDFTGMERVLQLTRNIADELIATPGRPIYQTVAGGDGRRLSVRAGFVPQPGDGDGKPGLPIQQVVSGGPAERAGLQAGDRILALDGQEITNIYDYLGVLKTYRPGDTITLRIQRQEQSLELKITLEAKN